MPYSLQVSNLGHHCVRGLDNERVTSELWVDGYMMVMMMRMVVLFSSFFSREPEACAIQPGVLQARHYMRVAKVS
jgi:hypothetical protein